MTTYRQPATRGLQRRWPTFLLALVPPAVFGWLGPQPVRPLYMVLAFAVSLAFLVLWILWREWKAPAFQSERQLAQYIPDVPLLGTLPDFTRLADQIAPEPRTASEDTRAPTSAG